MHTKTEAIINRWLQPLTVLQYQTPTTYVTDGLKPERVVTWEVGTEFAFFKNRLKTDFTYYLQKYFRPDTFCRVANSTGYEYKLLNSH